jgi:hypothetical protein
MPHREEMAEKEKGNREKDQRKTPPHAMAIISLNDYTQNEGHIAQGKEKKCLIASVSP